jgi:activator of HSP90 ATPase
MIRVHAISHKKRVLSEDSECLMSMRVTTIKQKTLIPAAPDEVYEAFMDAKKHSAFTGSKATCDPKVGGEFTAWNEHISGRNLELEKGKKIMREWRTTDWPVAYPPSKLELTFKKTKDGIEISMIHSNVPAEQADDLAEGWVEFCWTPLKDYFTKQVHKK